MENKTLKILLLGLGNDILTDDGIGVKLVKSFKENHIFDGMTYDTSVVGGMELIELFQGFDQAIIIDAAKTGKCEPGEIIHMTASTFQETLHMSSFHDMSFLTALQFAKKMKIQFPEQIDIIAIEIVEDLVFSNEFSAAISRNYEKIKDNVSQLVNELTRKKNPDYPIKIGNPDNFLIDDQDLV